MANRNSGPQWELAKPVTGCPALSAKVQKIPRKFAAIKTARYNNTANTAALFGLSIQRVWIRPKARRTIGFCDMSPPLPMSCSVIPIHQDYTAATGGKTALPGPAMAQSAYG